MSNEFNVIDAILDYKIFVEDTDTADMIKSKLDFYFLNEFRRLKEKYESDKKTLIEYYSRNLKQLYHQREFDKKSKDVYN